MKKSYVYILQATLPACMSLTKVRIISKKRKPSREFYLYLKIY